MDRMMIGLLTYARCPFESTVDCACPDEALSEVSLLQSRSLV